jgi:CHAT domain-containing protein/Tfp pilus assembly protein PilF
MKRIISLILFLFYIYSDLLIAQNEDVYNRFLKFSELNNSGDFIKAEELMLSVLKTTEILPEGYIVAAYNNLGVIYNRLGRYKEALECYNLAEARISNKVQDSRSLADIYTNKARIYTYQRSFITANDYLERGIRLYLTISKPDVKLFERISTAYLNIGIVHYEIKDYKTALNYFEKSAGLKTRYGLSDIELIYLNLAKVFVQTKNSIKAEEYFKKSIDCFITKFDQDYFRLAEVYFDYGLFLSSEGRYKESYGIHQKALTICIKNYGNKHPYVSLSLRNLGDHFLKLNDYDSALFYYQKSLIAITKNFNNVDVNINPSLDSVLLDVDLLKSLRKKSETLELLSNQITNPEKKLRTTKKSLETSELALQLIDRIRNDYLSEDSRMYLAENEKESYLFAIHIARTLFDLTNETTAVLKMYDIAKKAKAAVLRNEINENELLHSAGIPDSLRNKQSWLSGNISAYNNLILEEMRIKDPDNRKISLYKDAIFEMNRENENVKDLINKEYPQFHELLQKTEPLTLSEIQKNLSKDETVIDYLLSNQYCNGEREMYIFLITKDRLEFREKKLDSLFVKNLEIIRKNLVRSQSFPESGDSFREYTTSLLYMYDNLIKPVEGLLKGNRLIIIPDEEISRLPFDAFLRSKPTPDQADYEGLHYLIYDYIFSSGYSTSLIFTKDPEKKGGAKVYAFVPDYINSGISANGPVNLKGAGDEIEAIFSLFKGEKFTGDKATESNFREAIKHSAIFHLAMHSLSDSSNSRYSYMMFDKRNDTINDGKLYNYEISLSRINSPMVVLSACNSGTGTLFHGEGLMSLARGFFLAGASSVIRTSWEVNDEASAGIITRFYFHLSKGKSKDVAMRLAKLEYLKTNPPLYANPYYWAAYEVMGDNLPITQRRINRDPIFIILILILVAGLTILYYKRRSIIRARSL